MHPDRTHGVETVKFICHNGETVVVEVAGQPHTLTDMLRWYFKPGLLIAQEVQRWRLTEFTVLRLSRPVLKVSGRPVGRWRLTKA